ncbi:MAG: hypothetical protein M5R41_10600 [Bacteroidia bacterium]|nr:hypothetical protein [Bacteroidia bacterium]
MRHLMLFLFSDNRLAVFLSARTSPPQPDQPKADQFVGDIAAPANLVMLSAATAQISLKYLLSAEQFRYCGKV